MIDGQAAVGVPSPLQSRTGSPTASLHHARMPVPSALRTSRVLIEARRSRNCWGSPECLLSSSVEPGGDGGGEEAGFSPPPGRSDRDRLRGPAEAQALIVLGLGGPERCT